MTIVSFKAQEVLRCVEHALAAPAWSMGYDSEQKPKPALFLVGDHGVYLMSNGVPGDKIGEGPNNHVAYAEGLNPDKDGFDNWYDLKCEIFGGDDFAETLPMCKAIKAEIDAGAVLIHFKVTEDQIEFLV